MFYKENSTQNNYNRIIPPDNKEPSKFFRMPFFDGGQRGEYDELEFIYNGDDWAKANNPILLDVFDKYGAQFLSSKSLLDPSNSILAYSLYLDSSNNTLIRPPLGFSIDFNPLNCDTERSCGWILGFRQFIKNDSFYKSEIINYKNEYIRDNITFFGYLKALTPFGDTDNTYNYIYVDDFVGNYKDSLNAITKDFYLTRSLLAKIQINTAFFGIRYVVPLKKQENILDPLILKNYILKLLINLIMLWILKDLIFPSPLNFINSIIIYKLYIKHELFGSIFNIWWNGWGVGWRWK